AWRRLLRRLWLWWGPSLPADVRWLWQLPRPAARAHLLASSLDPCETAHIGAQDIRDGDRAVRVLVGFENRDQSTTHSDSRTVEGMHEAPGLGVRAFGARIHAPSL